VSDIVSCRLVPGATRITLGVDQAIFPLKGRRTMVVMYTSWSREGKVACFDILFDGKPNYRVSALEFPFELMGSQFCPWLQTDGEES
jgi:hypothetical protein